MYPAFRACCVTSRTAPTYAACVGYRLPTVAASKGSCDPYSRQNPAPLFSPVFVAVGTACSASRMPPRELPNLSRAATAGGPTALVSIGGAVGGGTPSLTQRTR